MLSPSDNLKELLSELHLCTPSQLLACESEVRRLAGDLPGFDSCWLDVLVAHRLLTPWQAQCLQSSDPSNMRQGPYRLREPLGQRTWQAETPDRSRIVVVSRLTGQDGPASVQLVERGLSLIETTVHAQRSVSSHVCLPREFVPHETEDGGWLASPYIAGWQLDELLIRGGRLPWEVVVEIGRGVLQGIDDLEQADLVHGDISLRNIRLRSDGQAVLVDPFAARLLRPTIGFRADLQLRDVQHCAPELAGSGRRHDSVSDLYSLGTVLWQLLTARPTSISADPVTFLMQCRDRDVEDVRQWVPDCPSEIARGIQLLTRRRPELRPQSAAEALETWKPLTASGVSATRAMLRRLPDRKMVSVARRPTLRSRRLVRTTWAAGALTVCVMAGLSSHLIPLPLNLTRTPVTVAAPETEQPVDSALQPPSEPVAETLLLPEVSPDGVIRLTGGQSYVARELHQPGTLRIAAAGDQPAVVHVPSSSTWMIQADQLQLSGVHVRDQGDTTGAARQLLDVRCQLLEMERVIVGHREQRRNTGLRWTPAATGSTVARVSNSVFLADRFGIHTTAAPGHFVLDNVLFDSTETAWRCDTGSPARVRLNMDRVTQLGGRSFADVVSSKGSGSMWVELTCGESVLTPEEALVRLGSADSQWTADGVTVAFRLPSRANPVIMQPAAVPVVWFDPSLRQKVALAEAQIISESLLMADPEFDSSPSTSGSFDSARLIDFDGPKRGDRLPGVDVTALPPLPSTEETSEGD